MVTGVSTNCRAPAARVSPDHHCATRRGGRVVQGSRTWTSAGLARNAHYTRVVNNAAPKTIPTLQLTDVPAPARPLATRAGDLMLIADDLRHALALAELAVDMLEQVDARGQRTRSILRMKTILAGLRR